MSENPYPLLFNNVAGPQAAYAATIGTVGAASIMVNSLAGNSPVVSNATWFLASLASKAATLLPDPVPLVGGGGSTFRRI